MTQTDNLHLKKPGADDFYNVEDFNENFDAIDKAVTEKAPAAHTHTKSEITDFPKSLPANGGNADTVDGYHADDFVKTSHESWVNQIQIPNDVDVPIWIADNAKLYTRYYTSYENTGLTNVAGGDPNDYIWYYFDGLNIIATCHMTKKVWIACVINGVFSDWQLINSSNADTFGGLHVGYFYFYHGDVPDNDCDNALEMGTYNAVPATSNTPFSSYWHIVVEYASNGSWIKQTATQSDKTNPLTYYRLFINDGWGDWIKVNINNKPHITSVTATESTIHLKWLPVDNATKYAVSIYNGGTGYTIYSLDITDTEYTITGLTVGTEYYILVQAYINDAWTYISAADHIIARTNAFSSGTATATKENCPVGAWYGQYEEV